MTASDVIIRVWANALTSSGPRGTLPEFRVDGSTGSVPGADERHARCIVLLSLSLSLPWGRGGRDHVRDSDRHVGSGRSAARTRAPPHRRGGRFFMHFGRCPVAVSW